MRLLLHFRKENSISPDTFGQYKGDQTRLTDTFTHAAEIGLGAVLCKNGPGTIAEFVSVYTFQISIKPHIETPPLFNQNLHDSPSLGEMFLISQSSKFNIEIFFHDIQERLFLQNQYCVSIHAIYLLILIWTKKGLLNAWANRCPASFPGILIKPDVIVVQVIVRFIKDLEYFLINFAVPSFFSET